MQDSAKSSARKHPLHGISLNRTVIIGLGSTGLKVLEYFQELWYERFSKTSNSLVRLINIETDSSNKPQSIDGNSMIQQITINNNNLNFDELVNYLRVNANPIDNDVPEIDWDWNWTKEINWKSNIGVAGAAGAGGIRAGGRLILYAPKNNQSQAKLIFDNIRKIIIDPQKWQNFDSPNDIIKKEIIEDLGYSSRDWVEPDIVKIDPVTGPYSDVNPYINKEIKVIVVGSLTGGTCSGTFIDMGFIIKKALNLNESELYKYLTGIFFIPPCNSEYLGGGIDTYRTSANTFGALYEIRKVMNDFFNKKGSAPYGVVYIVAPEYNTNEPSFYFDGIDGFAETIALRLFTSCLGYGLKIDASTVNIFTNNPRDYLFSFGVGAVLYPKFTLSKALALKLASEITERLIDTKEYIDDNNIKKIENILNEIRIKIDNFVNEKIEKEIYQQLTQNVETIKEKNNEWIEKFYYKSFDSRMFENEFTQKDGFYYSQWLKLSQNIENKIFEDFTKLIIERIIKWGNIEIILKIIDSFLFSLFRIRKLYETQNLNKFNDKLEDTIKSIFKNGFKFDKRECIESDLWLLYERFILFKGLDIIISLEEKCKNLKKNLENVKDRLNKYNENFIKDYYLFWNRLDTRIEKSPIIKLFKISKEDDFNSVREIIIGNNIKAGIDLFSSDLKETFCRDILNDNIDNCISDIINFLRKKAEDSLRTFLHSGNEQEISFFNIIEKMLEGKNVSSINTVFNIIKTGFLKRKFKEIDLVEEEGKEYVHHLISNYKEEDLRKIINNYSLYDKDTRCRPYSNVLFEDMVIYIKDIPRLKLNYLSKYEDLKKKFLEKPSLGFSHLTNKEWQRLRLTLSGELDFRIIEEEKKETIDKIRTFIKYFWLKPISKDKMEKIENPFYNVPNYYNSEEFLEEGLYFLNNFWYLKYKVKGSGQEISLCIDIENNTEYNKILESNQVYESLIVFFINNTEFFNNKTAYFISLLYKHWDSFVRPIYQNFDKYQTDYYEATFIPGYNGSEDFSVDKFYHNKHRSLIGFLLALRNN